MILSRHMHIEHHAMQHTAIKKSRLKRQNPTKDDGQSMLGVHRMSQILPPWYTLRRRAADSKVRNGLIAQGLEQHGSNA